MKGSQKLGKRCVLIKGQHTGSIGDGVVHYLVCGYMNLHSDKIVPN